MALKCSRVSFLPTRAKDNLWNTRHFCQNHTKSKAIPIEIQFESSEIIENPKQYPWKCLSNLGKSLKIQWGILRNTTQIFGNQCNSLAIPLEIHYKSLKSIGNLWSIFGTQPSEHNLWNTTSGTQLLEHNLWNTTSGTQAPERNLKNTTLLLIGLHWKQKKKKRNGKTW